MSTLRNIYKIAKKIIGPSSLPIILCYHAVGKRPDQFRPFFVDEENFIEHLKVLKKYYHPINTSELQLGMLNGRLPKKAAIITFDDNYIEHSEVVLPILKDLQVHSSLQ